MARWAVRKGHRRQQQVAAAGYDETPAGGQSLRMWSRYFPNATILGIDVFHKAITGPRIRFERGDAADAEFLRRVVDQYGPFDIVVDDGSHIGREIIAGFDVLWDAVKPGGLYVIEDLSWRTTMPGREDRQAHPEPPPTS